MHEVSKETLDRTVRCRSNMKCLEEGRCPACEAERARPRERRLRQALCEGRTVQLQDELRTGRDLSLPDSL